MKVLLYGSNGWIGKKMLNELNKQNIKVIIGNSRVDNILKLEEEIKNISPTHIISTIGRTHGKYNNKVYSTIDYLEQPGMLVENIRDNLFSPTVLSILSQKYNYHFTYLGTGCIFQFDDDHPFATEVNGFNEDSLPNFFGSSYSIVKGFTDQLMHLFNNNVLNIRIRMPITDEFNPRNFITKITTYSKICSIPNSMTVLDELIPIMVDMMTKNISGTYNFTNPGLISHNKILEMYRDIVDPNFKWENFSVEEQNKILDSGRSNNFLNTDKLITLYPNIKNINDSVKDVLIRMVEKKNS
jgi:nucleoside-diphosphate-sugar epimerase